MALMRLPVKVGADIFIQSGVIDTFFLKLKMAAAWDHPRSLISGAYLL